jgi:pyruvate kinase
MLADGKLGQKKNMCLPGSPITLPTVTEVDVVDIMDFALKYKCDQIAVSFTRRGKDLIDLRQMMINADPVHGRNIQLIAKIENHQGIENIDDIISQADGIMVARGDLGMEVPLEKVILCQKYMIDKAIQAGKFVINATQMLDSMETRVRPTRAEVADVTNSVYDLVDSTMLSGESAGGKFPLESVNMMKKICQESEYTTDYQSIF